MGPKGRRWRPRRCSDHVRSRRHPPSARVRTALAPRLRRRLAGAHRQRRRRPGPGRVPGGVLAVAHVGRTAGIVPMERGWELQHWLAGRLQEAWKRPDNGIWESRGERQHFVYSKVMCWVAFDSLVKGVERFGLDGPVERIRNELTEDGLVLRYRTDQSDDGLAGREGSFLICSFWMVYALLGIGRHREAEDLFGRLLALRNDVGLLSEEYDTRAQRLVGNFPQAFTHPGAGQLRVTTIRRGG